MSRTGACRGVVERDALAAYIATFDIALQPEVTAYASPLKLFEYMALSRAIVAPDAANIREVLDPRCRMPCCSNPTIRNPWRSAVRTLALDPALRARLGQGRRAIRLTSRE